MFVQRMRATKQRGMANLGAYVPSALFAAARWASESAESAALAAWNFVFVNPLRTLYFKGPSVHGYGFWGGVDPADACAQLTGVSALVWDLQTAACHDLLERNFFSFSTVVMSGLYVWLVYKIVQHLAFRYLYVRPLMAELRAVLRENSELTFLDPPPRLCATHPSHAAQSSAGVSVPAKGLCSTCHSSSCEGRAAHGQRATQRIRSSSCCGLRGPREAASTAPAPECPAADAGHSANASAASTKQRECS